MTPEGEAPPGVDFRVFGNKRDFEEPRLSGSKPHPVGYRKDLERAATVEHFDLIKNDDADALSRGGWVAHGLSISYRKVISVLSKFDNLI